MITTIFFIILFGSLAAVIVGTLGDEIERGVRRMLDYLHKSHNAEKQLRDYYKRATRQS